MLLESVSYDYGKFLLLPFVQCTNCYLWKTYIFLSFRVCYSCIGLEQLWYSVSCILFESTVTFVFHSFSCVIFFFIWNQDDIFLFKKKKDIFYFFILNKAVTVLHCFEVINNSLCHLEQGCYRTLLFDLEDEVINHSLFHLEQGCYRTLLFY